MQEIRYLNTGQGYSPSEERLALAYIQIVEVQ